MRWNAVAPTITAGCLNPSKGRFLHPDQGPRNHSPRGRSPSELPPGYSFSIERGMYAVAAMIGNALPPEFIRRHALQVAAALKDVGDTP